MKRITTLGIALVAVLAPGIALAEWSITNDDANSYEYKLTCGSTERNESVAGKVTRKYSIPAGSTSCTLTLKKNGSTCTVKDGEGCVIKSGSISKK